MEYFRCSQYYDAILSSSVVVITSSVIFLQVHDEREMDRVLGIEGVELIGINNRNLGKVFSTF